MEQRRLRLGDILDDYCPRERRVTNHAVVAMVEEDVKQTRCTTCDSEHAYKGGREPRRRKQPATSALYREVLADMPDTPSSPIVAVAPADELPAIPTASAAAAIDEPAVASADESEGEAEEVVPDVAANEEEGPINRPLIRATLPRPEGQKDPRPLPEFTMRHSGGRGQFRDRNRPGSGNPNGNGNRPHGRRFSGGHQPALHGRGSSGRPHAGGGFRGGQHQGGQHQGGQQQRHGGKKRSR